MRATAISLCLTIAACTADEPTPGLLDRQDCYPRAMFVVFNYVEQSGSINRRCKLAVEPTWDDVFGPGDGGGVAIQSLQVAGPNTTTRPNIIRAADGWYSDVTTLLMRYEQSDGVMTISQPADGGQCRWIPCEGELIEQMPPPAPVPWER